ncbi:YrhK family protein [Poseidonocella sp. HB161398]|uniref:YrhK family protein n=1 Tax=Poseidonocella sp. HB161398 TaxID=2320855 RepID=UPI001109CA74|nr:YrhK family protein [Poseidonocella sp. HB161398]
MRLFEQDHRQGGADKRRLFAAFEIAYTAVDFLAALLFVAGSIFFFYDSLMTAGTWLFLVGSICFAMKPTIRLWRELKLAAMGDTEDLAERARR